MSRILTEPAKKVTTYDASKSENGFLIELYKNKDNTVSYLTAAKPKAFKGYHLHRVRAARYVCIKGRMKIITYELVADKWVRSEHLLDANSPERMFIPKNIATGLINESDEEAWLINYPDPAYDPNLKDEQVEYTEEELEQGVVK